MKNFRVRLWNNIFRNLVSIFYSVRNTLNFLSHLFFTVELQL